MTGEGAALLLGQMDQSVRQALIYVDGLDRDDFLADMRTQQAVVLNLFDYG